MFWQASVESEWVTTRCLLCSFLSCFVDTFKWVLFMISTMRKQRHFLQRCCWLFDTFFSHFSQKCFSKRPCCLFCLFSCCSCWSKSADVVGQLLSNCCRPAGRVARSFKPAGPASHRPTAKLLRIEKWLLRTFYENCENHWAVARTNHLCKHSMLSMEKTQQFSLFTFHKFKWAPAPAPA